MPELPDRRGGTALTVALSLVGGLLVGLFSYVGAFTLWHGISTVIGWGDPTWNDGGGVWLIAFGLLHTGLVSFALYHFVCVLSSDHRPSIRRLIVLLWVLPAVALHVIFAASVFGLID